MEPRLIRRAPRERARRERAPLLVRREARRTVRAIRGREQVAIEQRVVRAAEPRLERLLGVARRDRRTADLLAGADVEVAGDVADEVRVRHARAVEARALARVAAEQRELLIRERAIVRQRVLVQPRGRAGAAA